MMLSNMHRGCIRRARRASCDPRATDGFLYPTTHHVSGRHDRKTKVLTYICRFGFALKVRLDGLVLLVKMGEIRNQVLDNVGVGERVDATFLSCVGGDTACMFRQIPKYLASRQRIIIHTQTSKSVDSVDVHGTTTADALSTASSKCQGGIHFIFDPDECIQHHRTGLVQVQSVALHFRLRGWLIWIPAVNMEGFYLCIWICGRFFNDLALRCWRRRSAGRVVDGGNIGIGSRGNGRSEKGSRWTE